MKLIVSIGDINGIGLEIFLKATNIYFNNNISKDIDFTLVGNSRSIEEYIEKIKDKLNFSCYLDNDIIVNGNRIALINIESYSKICFGELSKTSGLLAGKSIELASKLVIQSQYDALLTLPINKEAFNLANFKFPGHTEYIANLCNSDSPMMILSSKGINVALITIHNALKDVPQLISKELLHKRIKQLYNSLKQDFNIKNIKIALLSLNPHSGENGKFGNEEIDTIIPAMQESEYSKCLYGPFPADGFFAHNEYKEYSGILAMYHDQGLIPLKILAKGAGVNFTANLPIIRTSPDHGTAFAISGKGIADFSSTLEAINLAYKIYQNRKINGNK